MECKFIKHGIALSYDQVIKPCCEWRYDEQWKNQNHIKKVDLSKWHNSPSIKEKQSLLLQNNWPSNCVACQKLEDQGRSDSMRGNGNQAYAEYKNDDITLEIRPGSVCNFACQTCWPAASSRVAQYHSQAGLIDIKDVDSTSFDDFDFLLPVQHRIRDVVLLGGEPFYDKSCKRFLEWAQKNLNANIMMFTNGSQIDFDFLKLYKGRLTIIFSIDAIGRAAEYIRFGTDWSKVLTNFNLIKKYSNIDLRVNVTCSAYNYFYLKEVIEFLCQDWPKVVTFGAPRQAHMLEGVIPNEHRPEIINDLRSAILTLEQTQIELGQKQNAINALQSIIQNLETVPWSQDNFTVFCDFVNKMDRVKNIKIKDYCEVLSNVLQQNPA